MGTGAGEKDDDGPGARISVAVRLTGRHGQHPAQERTNGPAGVWVAPRSLRSRKVQSVRHLEDCAGLKTSRSAPSVWRGPDPRHAPSIGAPRGTQTVPISHAKPRCGGRAPGRCRAGIPSPRRRLGRGPRAARGGQRAAKTARPAARCPLPCRPFASLVISVSFAAHCRLPAVLAARSPQPVSAGPGRRPPPDSEPAQHSPRPTAPRRRGRRRGTERAAPSFRRAWARRG
jgi:hypothetical protein